MGGATLGQADVRVCGIVSTFRIWLTVHSLKVPDLVTADPGWACQPPPKNPLDTPEDSSGSNQSPTQIIFAIPEMHENNEIIQPRSSHTMRKPSHNIDS